MSDKNLLLAKAVLEKALRIDDKNKNYTIPRSYGVYEIISTTNSKKFRYGNHPVRESELTKEFQAVKVVALFLDKEDAKSLATPLNN